MRIDVFRWMTSVDYPPTLRSDDTTQPFSTIYVKALDCAQDNYPQWMGNFDAGSPGSAAELAGALDVYRSQGLGAVPWGVSRGFFPVDEGRMAGEAAAQETNGVYILDLEPYDGYWQAPGETPVRQWLQSFFANGGRELWISLDSRQGKPQEVHLDVWLEDPRVTRLMPQAYWTDFQLPWQQGIESSYLPLMQMGIDVHRIYPSYPLNATLDDLRDAINWSQQLPSFGGISLWRRGIAVQSTLDALLADPQPVFETSAPPPPPPPPPPVSDYVAGFDAGLRRAISLIEEELNGS